MSHAVKKIDPLTSGILKVTVKDSAGVLVSDATATATVYKPNGQAVAADVAMTNAGSGVYTLAIQASWSDAGAGVPLIGVFAAVMKFVRSGQQRTARLRYLVDFLDQ